MTGYKPKPEELADPKCKECNGTGYVDGDRCACTYQCTVTGCEGEPGSECIHCGAIMDDDT